MIYVREIPVRFIGEQKVIRWEDSRAIEKTIYKYEDKDRNPYYTFHYEGLNMVFHALSRFP
jgi:hypothetical protein